MEADAMTFAESIRAHRERLGLTQVELANRLGTNRRTLQNWEYIGSKDARIPTPQVQKLVLEKLEKMKP